VKATQAAPRLRLGFDYRAALHNREGIGRAQRASLGALLALLREMQPSAQVALLAATWRRPTVEAEQRLGPGDVERYTAWRLPARLAYRLSRHTGGVARWLGGLDLFHGLATQALWPGQCVLVATLFDLLFLEGPGTYLAADAADRMARNLERSLRHCARLQVPSQHVARAVESRLGWPRERIDIVPLGGDGLRAVPVAPCRLPAGPYVLTVGRIDPRKNLLVGLEAFKRVAALRPGLTWVLAGPAGYGAEAILATLRSDPTADRIEWRAQVSDAELGALYQHCQAFFFPALAEGFGLPPLEARHAGAPVAASNRTSLPEYLCDAGCRLAEPEDAAALAEALAEALDMDRRSLPAYSGPTWAGAAQLQWAALERALVERPMDP
jgi:glycosyltransferase involved in cell wall biosynthesis